MTAVAGYILSADFFYCIHISEAAEPDRIWAGLPLSWFHFTSRPNAVPKRHAEHSMVRALTRAAHITLNAASICGQRLVETSAEGWMAT